MENLVWHRERIAKRREIEKSISVIGIFSANWEKSHYLISVTKHIGPAQETLLYHGDILRTNILGL
jgi:hypothetical protein